MVDPLYVCRTCFTILGDGEGFVDLKDKIINSDLNYTMDILKYCVPEVVILCFTLQVLTSNSVLPRILT